MRWATKKIKAFTLAELLVTLALTAILIALAYRGLNYIQRLLKDYNAQSEAVTRISELEKRLQYQTALAREIRQVSTGELVFVSDSGAVRFIADTDRLLLVHAQQTDSFRLACSGVLVGYAAVQTPTPLVSSFTLSLHFRKQKFQCIFKKNYDAFSKLRIELADVVP